VGFAYVGGRQWRAFLQKRAGNSEGFLCGRGVNEKRKLCDGVQ